MSNDNRVTIEVYVRTILSSYVAGLSNADAQSVTEELRSRVEQCYWAGEHPNAEELDHLWDCACGEAECYEEDCAEQQKFPLLYEIMVEACSSPDM